MRIIQELILSRNNDLTEFFWPIFYYVKQNILVNHQIPLWNNLFFAGTPLINDPQNPVWYLPNIIFLVLNLDAAILVSILVHFIFGLIGMYLVSREAFRFSKRTAMALSSVYALSPIYFSYLEAGHWGLIICWAWLPYLILSAHQLVRKPNFKMVILFAAAASSLYFNHVLTALIALGAVGLYWLTQKSLKWTIPAAILSALIILPAFYLQYTWQKQTTRNLLLAFPETFPVWRGKIEFIKTLFIFNPETEKAITFGVIPSLAACLGFIFLRRKLKIVLLLILAAVSLVVLNNASPISSLLLKINFFVLMRVATRVWLLAYFALLYLFGLGLEKIGKPLAKIIMVASIIEILLIGASYLAKPIDNPDRASAQILKFLAADKEVFKVFCTTRCVAQKDAAIYGLHLADGYGTLQQQNYFKAAEQIGQYYWNRYSLEIPPSSIYAYNQLQPYAPALSAYGIKYVVSPHRLTGKNLKLSAQYGKYFIYTNELYRPLNYLAYSANEIQVANPDKSAQLTIPEIYNSGWQAYDEHQNKLKTFEDPDYTIGIKTNNSVVITLKFEPWLPYLNVK